MFVSFYVIFNLTMSSFNAQFLFRFGFLSQILPSNQETPLQVCDYSYGKWVRDESYPLRSYSESCPFLDPGFRCRQNGRKDDEYLKWRWQPHSCDLPRYEDLLS